MCKEVLADPLRIEAFCLPLDDRVAMARQDGLSLLMTGIAAPDGYAVLAAEDGRWEIWALTPDGLACTVAVGEGAQVARALIGVMFD